MTAVVVLVAAAGVMASVLGPPSSRQPAPGAAQPPPAQDTRFELLADSQDSAEASAQRLSEALDRALKRAAPDARWVSVAASDASNPTADGLPNIAPIFANGPDHPANHFSGTVNVESGTRQGTLTLMIHPQTELSLPPKPEPGNNANLRQPILLACAGTRGCTEGTGTHGEKLVTILTEASNYRLHEVNVEVAGNRILSITVATDVADLNDTNTPPLTMEQTTAIGVDVAAQIKA
jgi:hypothetical protein